MDRTCDFPVRSFLFTDGCNLSSGGILVPKVLILKGDAVKTHELYYPFWRLKEAGIEVTVAAPTKKEALYTVVHDFDPDGIRSRRSPATGFSRWMQPSGT
jgi:hypothetical protein